MNNVLKHFIKIDKYGKNNVRPPKPPYRRGYNTVWDGDKWVYEIAYTSLNRRQYGRCPECGKRLTEDDAYGHDCEAK